MQFNLSQEMYQSPIMTTSGVEVLANMLREGDNLDRDLLELTQQLLEERLGFVAVAGPNSSGKGGLLKGIDRVFRLNEGTRSQFDAKGIKLDILRIPFSLCDDLAQLPDAPEQFRVPPQYNPSTFTLEHTNRISDYQWHLIEKYALASRKGKRKATLVMVEASTPLVVPINNTFPVHVEGIQNLGFSTFANLAVHPKTRGLSFWYLLDRENKILIEASKFRKGLRSNEISARQVFAGPDRVVVSDSLGGDHEAEKLAADQQEALKRFIALTHAPAEAIELLDVQLKYFLGALHERGLIKSKDNRGFYEFLAERLGIIDNPRFAILTNPVMAKRRTDDMTYFLDSLPIRLHPELAKDVFEALGFPLEQTKAA